MLRLFDRTILFAFCILLPSIVLADPPKQNPHTNNPHAVASKAEPSSDLDPAKEAQLIRNRRQLTFEGRRAGEGYFSADGTRMVFQSERDPANPFYQIYVTDLETGDIEKVSPGTGKTTCAWIHPKGETILFASTHHDADAVKKQDEEIALRKSGKQRRYAWDYDPAFELYARAADGTLKQLTSAKGYDAEASYSPDGTKIVFASNRQAFSGELSKREEENFKVDPAFMNDIYIMGADGENVERLTDVPGYDGGPFFSPDGQRICWRRFAENGATAEVYTMKIDGTDVKRLTEINAMSWAPYYHPSSDYLIFTTNKHGFSNFELYLVRADGEGDPVRVTYTDGFDGLPVFLPDGHRLSWTSNRTKEKRSQIFMADWDDAKARQLLGLSDNANKDKANRDNANEDRPSCPDRRPRIIRWLFTDRRHASRGLPDTTATRWSTHRHRRRTQGNGLCGCLSGEPRFRTGRRKRHVLSVVRFPRGFEFDQRKFHEIRR